MIGMLRIEPGGRPTTWWWGHLVAVGLGWAAVARGRAEQSRRARVEEYVLGGCRGRVGGLTSLTEVQMQRHESEKIG